MRSCAVVNFLVSFATYSFRLGLLTAGLAAFMPDANAGDRTIRASLNNGIDLVNPLSDPTVSNNCTENYPGWYCDPKLTELLRQYSETYDPVQRKQLEGQIQVEFHSNVNLVLAGQFSAPMAYRSDLKGVVPFGFPVFWGMERK
jgi:peptide/nickel transport system substrate-binding protein